MVVALVVYVCLRWWFRLGLGGGIGDGLCGG